MYWKFNICSTLKYCNPDYIGCKLYILESHDFYENLVKFQVNFCL